MSHPCQQSELDALLAGELSPEQEERVRAHAEGCAACARELAWLRMERGWMAQRARRTPPRAALDFSALEARLRPPALRGARWAHRGKMAMGAAAAMAFMAFSLLSARPIASLEDPLLGDGLSSAAAVNACVDPFGDAVALHEARFAACLLATPAQPLD
jgi:anti-sigma factor RsiW